MIQLTINPLQETKEEKNGKIEAKIRRDWQIMKKKSQPRRWLVQPQESNSLLKKYCNARWWILI